MCQFKCKMCMIKHICTSIIILPGWLDSHGNVVLWICNLYSYIYFIHYDTYFVYNNLVFMNFWFKSQHFQFWKWKFGTQYLGSAKNYKLVLFVYKTWYQHLLYLMDIIILSALYFLTMQGKVIWYLGIYLLDIKGISYNVT